jgi:GTP-binding protein YchF
MLKASPVSLRRGCGIVGLPNIGKSTFFNAITCSQLAKTGNYEFCTINANLSKAKLYDYRLYELAKFTGAAEIVPAELDVADVAGLIEGASKGLGLGNKFLNDIRPVNIILHMVRCFESAKDGFGTPDPLGGISVIDTELVLADIESVERKISKLRSRKATDPELLFAKAMHAHLENGKAARVFSITKENQGWLADMQLLSAKPVIFVLNVDEFSMKEGNQFSALVEKEFGAENTLRVCSVIEEQTAQMSRPERLAFLEEYGVSKPQSEAVLEKVRGQLQLQSFFTVGPKMAHAWQIPKGTTARAAAGEIHGDFDKWFVSAKVLPWQQYVQHRNIEAADKAMKDVPGTYVMDDGHVFIVDHRAPK